MDPAIMSDDEDKEKLDVSQPESIKNESDKLSITSSIKYGSLSEQLTSQMESYYLNNRVKFIKQSVILENSEINNEEAFKAIYRFSKRQSGKMENKLNRSELPKFKHSYLEHGDERLANILNKKNMKNRKFKKTSLDSDSDEDSLDLIEEENETDNKLNLNEELAKKFNKHCEKVKFKTGMLQLMYRKAVQNQEASKKLIEYNSLEKFNMKKNLNQRPKTSGRLTKNSMSTYDGANTPSSNLYVLRPKTSFKEKVTEKSTFDVSRNLMAQDYSFRVAKNELNSNIEIFKLNKTEPAERKEMLTKRPKTTQNQIARRHSEHKSNTDGTVSMSNSTLLSNSFTRYESPKYMNNFDSLKRAHYVSFNMHELIKNSKILEAKCLSTFWTNYAV